MRASTLAPVRYFSKDRTGSFDVRTVEFRAGGVETLTGVHGRIACQVITGPAETTNWIARSDGHLVRLRWTLPNGTTIWKLPTQDVALR